jgi:glycosyltransferase involved in cell wall biosynthesis
MKKPLLARIKQLIRGFNHRRLRRRRAPERLVYQQWVKDQDTLHTAELKQLQIEVSVMHSHPNISVLMPVYNPNLSWLKQAIESVQAQVYPDWELCIADDCSTTAEVRDFLRQVAANESRIKLVFRAANGHISACSNTALTLCTGQFTALMDQDDLLHPKALLKVAQCINAHPDAGMIYSNEDKLGPEGLRESPSKKAPWHPSLLLEVNHFSHLGVFKTELMQAVGGFRIGLEGAQDHDLALRCSEQIRPDQIHLIPDVLYHWRMHPESTSESLDSKPYALKARNKCIQEHVDRVHHRFYNS